MRAYQIVDDWDIENLTLRDIPKPEPGPGQVLLRMRAASLNYRDLVVPQRGYGAFTGELPLVPVSDGVGEVVELGPGVEGLQLGDRVCPLFMPLWQAGEPDLQAITRSRGGPLDGVMVDYMAVDATGVAAVPEHLSDEQAATLPCAAVTAWNAVMEQSQVGPGDRVLIQGTGGVSLFALQFARMAGAWVMVTSSSDEKLERARQLGADAVLNYVGTPQWGKPARLAAGGDGFDHIVEVGGAQTLEQSLRAIRPGGTLSLIGVLSGGTVDLRLGQVVTRRVRLQGVTVGHRQSFEAMCRAIAQHRSEPVVDRVFAFEQLREALEYLRSGAHFGKICLRH